MKKVYTIFLYATAAVVLSWFLPWLYGMLLPEAASDPFVAFSPVSDEFVVSEGSGSNLRIFTINGEGKVTRDNLNKEQRDSLLPHVYFNQLTARGEWPDSIGGDSVSIPMLKQAQWTFTSMPLDINKRQAEIYMMMESMPPRFELQDPKEAFTLDGEIEFVDMATNTVNVRRSQAFGKVMADRGFRFPLKSHSANITTRKSYDEGYLLIDAAGDLFHLKMQAGMPYMVRVERPDSADLRHVFILENPETRHLGLVTDAAKNLYVLEKEGYRLVKLPIEDVDPERDRIAIFKTYFNWIVKLRSGDEVRWVAIGPDSYDLLGEYVRHDKPSSIAEAGTYIFPFVLSFTSLEDSYAYPRITDISCKTLILGAVLAIITAIVARCRRLGSTSVAVNSVLVLFFGIYYFVPFLLVKD